MPKNPKPPKGNEPSTRHRGHLWGPLMEIYQGRGQFDRTYYLDLFERRVVSMPSELPQHAGEGWTAEHENLKARLESTPQVLVPIPIYSSEDEAQDWGEFLLSFPDPQFRKKLDRASREFNGGSRDLLNRLVEDYPAEEARWTGYRDKRMQARLESWLQSVGVWL